MARHLPSLVLLVGILLMVPGVGAQSGVCPDFSDPLAPIPTGSYPQTMALCAELTDFNISVDYSAEYPCNSALVVDPTIGSMFEEWPELFIVYPTSQSFPTNFARLRFEYHGDPLVGANSSGVIRLRSYTDGGTVLYTTTIDAEDYPSVISGFGHLYYLIDVQFPVESNGFVGLQLLEPPAYQMSSVYYSSIQIIDSGGIPPALCEVPGATMPTTTPTPSPTDSPTPSPTNSPTHTPTGAYDTPTPSQTAPASTNTPTPQSFPTAPGGTFTPRPSSTPIPLLTIPAENTPTPWPAITLPPLDLPTIEMPAPGGIDTPAPISVGLTPDATTAATQAEIDTWVDGVGVVATRWYTATLWGATSLSTTITSTTGISTPLLIAQRMEDSITTPISYAKSIQMYMPNIWPMVFFLILATAWVFFNIIAKFAVAIGSELLDILYRLWESIPFLN